MKALINIFFKSAFLLLLLFCLGLQTTNIYAQTTAIPDPLFEQVLIDRGIDSDGIINGLVLTSDIDTVITLDLVQEGIHDLTGVEGFTALEFLDVSNNNLTIIDVSNNIQLKELYASNYGTENLSISSLDLSNNINLEILECQNLFNLENLNIKNGNNTILIVFIGCEDEGEPCELTFLNCVIVDDEIAATNNEIPYLYWLIDADFIYSEDCVLGTEDASSTNLILFPNPVQDLLTINNARLHEITSIKLYDILGRLVMEENKRFNQVDVSHLNNGLYLVKIETDKGLFTKKIIKE